MPYVLGIGKELEISMCQMEKSLYSLTTEMTPKVYDARGNGGGQTVNTLTGDHQNRITDYTALATSEAVVRRLTPKECERLQGFPDGWTDIGEWTDSKGKLHKPADSPRYKALGNSIALPYWRVLAKRVAEELGDDLTMGSLFDGIGGFPLSFSEAGVKPVWASEIEEFPIAVTKRRFPDEKEQLHTECNTDEV